MRAEEAETGAGTLPDTSAGSGAAPTPRTIVFGPLTIGYDDRLLEPRPWTVQQSEWAATLIAAAPPGPVLELCSGAGHIGLLAIMLARSRARRLVCVDVSPAACTYARSNARAAGLDEVVEVREGRLDAVLAPEERFAVVIADPPWVRTVDIGRFPEDPVVAIDGGADGTDLARACLEVAAEHLLPGGDLVLQVGNREQIDRLAVAGAGGTLRLVEVRDGERGVLARFTRPAG